MEKFEFEGEVFYHKERIKFTLYDINENQNVSDIGMLYINKNNNVYLFQNVAIGGRPSDEPADNPYRHSYYIGSIAVSDKTFTSILPRPKLRKADYEIF